MAADPAANYAPIYSQYPWKHVNSLTQVYRDTPVLLALELTTLTIYLTLLLHSIRHRRLSALVSATLAGAVNEVTFTSVPYVNNFWHAQAWLMLGPRLPVWQPALYGFFLYTASQSAERLSLAGWHPIGRAAVAGLLGFLTLFPLDAVCVKFVAYTWHDSDPLLADRLLGVAVGNGMFAAVFPGCFAALLAGLGPLAAVALSTPAMMAVTLPFSLSLGNGLPSRAGLAAILVAMATAAVVAATWTKSQQQQQQQPHQTDWTLTLAALSYFAVLLTVTALANPAAQKSVGFHQPLSATGTADLCRSDTDMSASGLVRRVFLCPDSMTSGDFDPTCDPGAGIDQHWYAVCGRSFGIGGNGGRRHLVASLAGLAALAIGGLAGCQVA